MDIGTVASALSSLMATRDLIAAAISVNDFVKAQSALAQFNERFIELQNTCITVQEKSLALTQENGQLKEDARKRENFEAEISRYELKRFPGGGRCLVKEPVSTSQATVYLCANCAAEGKKTYLQEVVGTETLNCHIHGAIYLELRSFGV